MDTMDSELRRDYFTDRRVIIAVGRGRRPTDFKHDPAQEGDTSKGCFFCPGNESMTPPEITRISDGAAWAVRVFPNKFPAVNLDMGESKGAMMPAYGRHEIVVETPEHSKTVADLSEQEMSRVIEVYAQRVESMLKDPKTAYALVFKNHGRVAGASLAHSHTQIVSLPIVPQAVADEAQASERYRKETGRCPICDAWKAEMGGPRAVWEDEHACVFAPYASRSPLEAWIAPKRHVRSLSELSAQERLSFARAITQVTSRLKRGLNDAPYNYYLHLSPAGGDLHLHMELQPRLAILAGFELGSGIVINTMAPEAAAEFYRQK
jgi:UDPglucose--hexose-1-phosphate uridylyltransferase